ncbi:hypothetical protein BZA70DRAFT_276507 [Myxozyma melibiosi]|uniref:Outer spore wall protein RRT8 n=1 Tax=Myxozyma melibiosi TaxID=54550 RepID=A0ABR1FBH4_9ASCO
MWFLPLSYAISVSNVKSRFDRIAASLRSKTIPDLSSSAISHSKMKVASALDRLFFFLYTGITYRILLIFIIPYTAVTTCAVRYPFYGIGYFLWHPVLWPSFVYVVLPLIIIMLIIYSGWFAMAYPPMVVIMIILNGPAGVFTSFFMVFNQAYSIYSIIAKTFIIKGAHKKVFDTVLRLRGLEDFVADSPANATEPEMSSVVLERASRSAVHKLRAQWRLFILRLTSPFLLLKNLLLIPIQFIPFVGPFIAALLKSLEFAKAAQMRYFQLKAFTPRETRLFIRRRYGGYITFGAVAGILETLPIVGMFFSFTNVTGAALWAAKMERREQFAESTNI